MEKLQCSVCGGQIEIQDDGRGLCTYCGAAYSLGSLKSMLNGAKVSVTGSSDDVDQWRQLVDKYCEAGDYIEAERIVKKILEARPNDAKANEQYNELQNLKYFEIKNGVLVKYTGKQENIEIPKAVKTIENGAFEGCYEIQSIHVPSSVRSIKSGAFRIADTPEFVHFPGMAKLEKVIIDEGINELPDTFDPAFIMDTKCFLQIPASCNNVKLRRYVLTWDRPQTWAHIEWAGGAVKWKVAGKRLRDDGILDYLWYETVLMTREEAQQESRQEAGVCRYCGGQFGGLIKLKCKVCGKPKDYT